MLLRHMARLLEGLPLVTLLSFGPEVLPPSSCCSLWPAHFPLPRSYSIILLIPSRALGLWGDSEFQGGGTLLGLFHELERRKHAIDKVLGQVTRWKWNADTQSHTCQAFCLDKRRGN